MLIKWIAASETFFNRHTINNPLICHSISHVLLSYLTQRITSSLLSLVIHIQIRQCYNINRSVHNPYMVAPISDNIKFIFAIYPIYLCFHPAWDKEINYLSSIPPRLFITAFKTVPAEGTPWVEDCLFYQGSRPEVTLDICKSDLNEPSYIVHFTEMQ